MSQFSKLNYGVDLSERWCRQHSPALDLCQQKRWMALMPAPAYSVWEVARRLIPHHHPHLTAGKTRPRELQECGRRQGSRARTPTCVPKTLKVFLAHPLPCIDPGLLAHGVPPRQAPPPWSPDPCPVDTHWSDHRGLSGSCHVSLRRHQVPYGLDLPVSQDV